MRTVRWMVMMALGLAGTARAQERGMIATSVGVATTSEATSGAIDLEYGVALNRHLVVYGGIGKLMNVAPAAAQPAVDATISTLAASNVDVTGTPEGPAWYGDGGVRYLIPLSTAHVQPYIFGGAGHCARDRHPVQGAHRQRGDDSRRDDER